MNCVNCGARFEPETDVCPICKKSTKVADRSEVVEPEVKEKPKKGK